MKYAATLMLGLFVVLLMGCGSAATGTTDKVKTAMVSTKTTMNKDPSLNKNASQILAEVTDYYAQLFQSGQQALGTTQYPDAYAGLDALHGDLNSAANIWSKFNSSLTSSSPFTTKATPAYDQASNLFGDNPPTAISDWFSDINQLDADIRGWAQTATNWQISAAGSDELNAKAQKVDQDIAQAKADIARL